MADYANRLTHQQKRADTRGNGSPSGKHVGGSTPTQQYKNRIQAKLADGSHGRSLPKLKVGSAYDGAEVEADHAAREVVHGRGVEGSAGVPVKPLAQRISRQVQRSEDEEASAKVLRSEDEEVSAKVLRSEDEEASAKVLREEDENASAKVQRSEDEEASAKVLRSEDEEVSAKVLRAEDEEASAKVLRAEDEEASAKVLRTEDEEASAKVLRSEDEEASAKVLRAEDGEASAKVMREEDEDKGVQMKATPEDHRMGFTAAESTAALLQTQKGMGEPLPAPLKAEMEAGFGADFSQVRMHTGSTSGQLNTELGAKAFTHGRDVFFGEGQFDPESDKGKELVAHELAHTVQQGEAKPLAPAGPGAKGGAEKGGSSPTPAVESPEAKTAAPEVAEVPAVTPEGAVGGEAEAASAEAGQGGEEDGEKEKGEEGGGKKVKKTRANAPKAPQTPEEDPAFQATKKQVKKTAAIQQVHPDPETKVAEMEGAAVLSEEEQAQQNDGGAHMGAMEAVAGEREPFTPETFKEQLKEQLVELEKQLPKDSDSAEEFKEEDPIGGIKENIAGTAEAEQQKIAGPLDQQAKAETPPASGLPTVAEVPLAEEPAGKAPAPIDQQAATPKPKTDEEISMEEESASLDEYMAENDVTEEQLARSNEPKFLEALDSKKEAQAQAAAAPGEYRAKENEQLGAAQAIAAEQGHAGLQGMFDARTGVFGGVLAEQGTAEKGSEDKQAEIKAKFEEIYNRTKDAVTAKLDALSDKVSELFDTEAEAAKKTFEENVEEKLDDIYGVTVIDDWLFGEDTEAIENVFVEEKATFINTMDGILDRIAVMIADELNGAMQLIADGREESKVFYEGLDESQKTLAQETYDSFNDQYTSLEETVAEKESELAQELAASYKENVDSLRAAFDEIKERVSAGWIGAALNFLVGVIKAILEIAKMLLSLLAAVVEAVGAILKDPIGFLSNLISGVKQGFELFFTNIKTHIITGLVEWLTGSLGGVGITVPTDLFSLPGIFSLVAQILGLSWDYFRNKAVKMLGEPVVKTMEGTVEVFQVIRTGGIGALWEFISGQFQDLKEMVMDAIRDMVITKVIEAGIKWIMGLMSPAGAFIKAAMMIIDIVRFFVERAAQIVELVQAFIDGIRALASGGVGAVAKAIETALAKAIPVLIGFLAALVGVTGLTGKVQKIVGRVRKRVDKAMTKLISKAAKLFRRGKKVGKDGKVKEIEDNELTPADHKKHARYIAEIKKSFVKANKKKPETFADFYTLNRKLGDGLEEKYNKKLTKKVKGKPIRTTISMMPLAEESKDNDLDLQIKIAPNDSAGILNVPFTDEDFNTTEGSIALYRGLYFTIDDSKNLALRNKIKSSLIHFSPAVEHELTGNPNPSPSDLSGAVERVMAELEAAQNTEAVTRYWVKSKEPVPNELASMLSLYVDDHSAFLQDLETHKFPHYENIKSPFISTTKREFIAGKYAMSNKKDIKAKQARIGNRGNLPVGMVFVYNFNLEELNRSNAIDIPKSSREKKIIIGRMKYQQDEVAFAGKVPNENLVGEVVGFTSDTAEYLSSSAREKAESKSKGGKLREWKTTQD